MMMSGHVTVAMAPLVPQYHTACCSPPYRPSDGCASNHMEPREGEERRRERGREGGREGGKEGEREGRKERRKDHAIKRNSM